MGCIGMTDITRRTALAAKASAVVAAGTALPAAAATSPRPSWEKGKAKDFASLTGTTFVGLRENGEAISMTLVSAERVDLGPARPRHLPRSEGVTLVFECDTAEQLLSHESVRVAHPALGKTTLFLGAEPKKSGGYRLCAAMN